MTYSHMGKPHTTIGEERRFTAEFGMGSGGSNTLWSSSETVVDSEDGCLYISTWNRDFKLYSLTLYFAYGYDSPRWRKY